MTHTTTTTTSLSHATEMGNSNKKSTSHSFSANDLTNHSGKSTNSKDVAKWSSAEVQRWIKKQCKRYELKKATAEKFEMNGQALVLLTKHDFIRRSPEGGEVLYYNLQHLINPNKINSTRLDQQTLSRGGPSDQHSRIVEISEDTAEFNRPTDSSSPRPIVEEPDDPPAIRRSQSDTQYDNYQQPRPQGFFFQQAHARPAVVTMSAGSAAAYFHQQQGLPNGFMFAQPQPHAHLHMHQPFFFQPHLLHQYHPMMSAQGILIEAMDDEEPNINIPDGINGQTNGAQQLYMVTVNGQRFVMNEGQVKQLVTEVFQRQAVQEHLQRQQLAQQQQLFQQQQLLLAQQQQQYFARQQQQFAQQQYAQQQQQQQHFHQQQPQQQQQSQQQPQSQRF